MEIERTGALRQAQPGARATDVSPTEKLEQAFLEEMLKYCGPTAQEGSFGGGAGENQFQSFLTRHYAEVLADRIDLGLRLAPTGGDA